MAAKTPAYSGEIIYSCADEYGPIAVVEEATSRTLHFGSTARQSTMYLNDSVRLALSYTRCMLAGLLFVPPPRRVLVLGLGGDRCPSFCCTITADVALKSWRCDRLLPKRRGTILRCPRMTD